MDLNKKKELEEAYREFPNQPFLLDVYKRIGRTQHREGGLLHIVGMENGEISVAQVPKLQLKFGYPSLKLDFDKDVGNGFRVVRPEEIHRLKSKEEIVEGVYRNAMLRFLLKKEGRIGEYRFNPVGHLQRYGPKTVSGRPVVKDGIPVNEICLSMLEVKEEDFEIGKYLNLDGVYGFEFLKNVLSIEKIVLEG